MQEFAYEDAGRVDTQSATRTLQCPCCGLYLVVNRLQICRMSGEKRFVDMEKGCRIMLQQSLWCRGYNMTE